jgi:uncharacterized protein (DUF1684 family)
MDLIAQIQAVRSAKDSLLRYGTDSPLPATQRADFAGLYYFPVDLRFRLAGELHIYGRRQQIQVSATDGTSMAMERFGRFVTQLEGKPFWLEVHRSLENNELSIMFKDATNGQSTYSGGRYAALSRLDNLTYILDFNTAYNPYCAYDSAYVCPLPPAQNYLTFEILAGEQTYGANLAH